ncbi:MAG: tetratricopeptide repeat protein [Chloroflexota bacterium]
MLLDQPVVLALDGAWKRFVRAVGSLGEPAHAADETGDAGGPWSAADWQHSLDLLASTPAHAAHAMPDAEVHAPEAPTPAPEDESPEISPAGPGAERRIQAALVRASLLAGQGRHDEAEAAFSEALALDPDLDLAAAPAFWDLGRGGQESAVRALDAAGRSRDAMILRSRLENRYRPRLVRSA